MKKLACFALVLVLCTIACTAFASSVVISQNMQIVDSLDGVPAYYRPGTWQSDGSNSTYSCAAFAKRYFNNIYGVSLSGLDQNKTPSVSKGKLTQTTSPVKGALAFWSASPHSAIVKSVSGNNVTLIEQNQKTVDSKGRTIATVGRVISKSTSGVKFYHWSGTSSSPSTTGVTFYGDINGQGWSVVKPVGTNAQKATAMGFNNDQLSSIRIPSVSGSQIKVTVYEHDNYAGRSVTFSGAGLYNLTSSGFNDLCSSYQVYLNGSNPSPGSGSTTTSTVTFYGDRDGKGWSAQKAVGTNAQKATAMGFNNDQLSSIRIPSISGGQIKVTLYEHDNYAGRSITFSGEGLFNLQPFGFDDICSSYKIYK